MYSFPRNSRGEKALYFWLDAIELFLSKQCFCLLITTVQNMYMPNETSLFHYNICCIHLKRKTAA